jgi:hypothetical protein
VFVKWGSLGKVETVVVNILLSSKRCALNGLGEMIYCEENGTR